MKIVDNLEGSWRRLRTRSGLALLVTAALLLQVSGVVQYFFSRNGIRTEVRQRARTELMVKNLEVKRVVDSVEVAVDNLKPLLEWSVSNPDSIYAVLEFIIRQNPSVSGCAIAFEPDYFPGKGRWFEPFSGRKNGVVVRDQIGGEGHDYLNADWYKEGLAAGGGRWTEPYFDDAGSRAAVCSYTVPIHDASGRVAGLFCSDVSLDWMTDLFSRNVTAPIVVVSRNGKIVACPDEAVSMHATIRDFGGDGDDSMAKQVGAAMLSGDSGHANIRIQGGRKAYVYYAPVEGKTGWSMAVTFFDDEIYEGLHKVSFWLSIVMVLGLLLLVFIMWRTVRNINKLGAISAEKERIAGELQIASGIQKGMLPKTFPPFPDCDEVAMAGSLTPAKEVGGDLYDFHIRDGQLFFCIGDVSGKGVPASLVMAVTRSHFRSASAHTDSPQAIMQQMNNAMSEMNESSMFVTLFVGVLDLRTGRLSYCNAGHCPPMLVGKSCTPLKVDANIPLGLMAGWEYTMQETMLPPGSSIFAYTDGLTEAENAGHAQFGEERLRAVIEQGAALPPQQLVDSMSAAVHAFVGDAEQSDDLTMLVIQFNKLCPERR